MQAQTKMRWLKWFAVPLMLAVAPAALAQGCVMCYTTAASQGPRAIHALNQAILVLLLPPLAMFAGIFGFIYRRRNISREC